jgi:alanine racemase
MSRPTQMIIHLGALQHNFRQIKSLAPHSAVLAMLKSNAYGHGLERIALALPDADALGVACMEEALQLRAAGIRHGIVLMEGLFNGNELEQAITEQLTLVVHHEAQIQMLEKHRSHESLSIWLKINTGMNRLGFSPGEVKKNHQRLLECPIVKKPVRFMTHFATANSPDPSQTQHQIELFNAITQGLKGPRSLCNSAGILAWPAAQYEWVRPGLTLYGVSPFAERSSNEFHLRPVMSLQSKIMAIQRVSKGSHVGYGASWMSPEDKPIGIVPIGYGDGYPQYAQHGTPVLVNGHLCPLAGRVSMDMLTVDLSNQPQAKPGDPVVLWGEGLPIEKVAANNHTSPWELLTRVTARVRMGED